MSPRKQNPINCSRLFLSLFHEIKLNRAYLTLFIGFDGSQVFSNQVLPKFLLEVRQEIYVASSHSFVLKPVRTNKEVGMVLAQTR